jgi:hypothetical protein
MADVNLLLPLLLATAQPLDAGTGIDLGSDALTDAGQEVSATPDAAGNADAVSQDEPSTPRMGVLRGRILARGSRGPVLGARISATALSGQRAVAESDDDGRFQIALPCATYAVNIHAPGFDPVSLGRDPCFDSEPLLVRLAPRPNLPLYETIVTAPSDEPKLVLRRQELTTTPGSLGDPLRVVESLPGVATVAWPAPIYAVRGSNPGNTGYFLDDVQVPMLFHLALGPSVIHPYFFDSITFYPGGYPAQYGRYVAGIVTAQTRPPAEDAMHASVEVRLYDAGALVTTPWPDRNGGAAVAFRYSYTGALLGELQNDVTLAYWDYQVRLDRRLGSWRIALLVMGSSDDLTYGLSSPPAKEYAIHFHRAGVRVTRSVGAGLLYAHLSASADHSAAPILGWFPITVDAYSLIPRLGYQLPSRYVDLDIGADGQVQWFEPVAGAPEAEPSGLGSKRTVLLASAYVSASVRAGSRLTLTPGLRLDSYTIQGTSRASVGPRLALRFALDDTSWLSGSGGRFSQAPSLAVQIPGAENFGLDLYGLQSSWQGALGIGTRRLRAVEIEATGFVQRYVLTDLRDPTLNNRDPFTAGFLVQRDARAYGLELMIRRPGRERLHGWLSYTLSKSERALGGGVAGPSDWDQRHILNMVLGYRFGSNTVGTRLHVNTGRPVLLRDDQAERFVRLPTFYQLDLRAERRMVFDSFTLDVYLEIVNATLRRTVLGLDRDPLTNQISQTSYRIVLPSIGIRGEI